jgi:betaine reductase
VNVFDGKKVIVLGERDGVAAPAIAACVRGTRGEVILSITECFA